MSFPLIRTTIRHSGTGALENHGTCFVYWTSDRNIRKWTRIRVHVQWFSFIWKCFLQNSCDFNLHWHFTAITISLQGSTYLKKFLLARLSKLCISLISLFRFWNKTLAKSLCPTGSSTCLGMSGNRICQALFCVSTNSVTPGVLKVWYGRLWSCAPY